MRKIQHLLATDLDGTFVGDKEGLNNLLSYYESLEEPVSLAYITGRHRSSVENLIYEKSLPIPDLLITDVGAIIYSGPRFLEDKEWEHRMLEKWYPSEILKIASTIPGLVRQVLPNNRRISFHSKGSVPARVLEKKLEQKNIPHTFIFSSNKDVDILPPRSGKGEALKFLMNKYVSEKASILVAGDSGNDLNMLLAGYPSVIVANAQPELLDIETTETLFRAKSPYAHGILEAWQHFYGNDS